MGGRERETDVHGFFDFYRDQVLPKLRASA
jgi:hypothetical protein